MTPETFNEELDISAACGDYLRGKYGAHRGHPEWRAMDEAFRAGVRWQAERAQPTQKPYGWHATGTIYLICGDGAESEAKQMAKQCGGASQAIALYENPPDTTALLPQALDAMVQARLWVKHEMLDAAIDSIRKHLVEA